MSYKVNHTDTARYGSLIVEDKTVNTETSLRLIGKKYAGYSKIVAENMLHLLENFANIEAPSSPVIGQLWYDSDAKAIVPNPSLKIWNGTTWIPSGNVIKSLNVPTSASIGDLWVDLELNQLKLKSASDWISVGPVLSIDSSNKKTGLVYESIEDSSSTSHTIIKLYILDVLVAVFCTESFIPKSTNSADGFSELKAGLNINPLYKFQGTAIAADSLIVNNTAIPGSNFLISNSSTPTLVNGLKILSDNGLTFGSVSNPPSLKIQDSIVTLSSVDKHIAIQSANSKLIVAETGISANTSITINDASLTAASISTAGEITANTVRAKELYITNQGKLTVNGTIVPSTTGVGDIGTISAKWAAVNANVINCDTLNVTSPIGGTLSDSTTINNKKIVTTGTKFKITGEVVSGESFVDAGSNVLSMSSALHYSVVSGKNELSTKVSTDFNILNNTKLLSVYNNVIYVVSLRKLMAPLGSIILHAGMNAPDGYLLCDGSQYNIIEYELLYHAIGVAYGGGGGKFNVPLVPPNGSLKYYIYAGD